MATTKRLSANDWSLAALEAIAAEGVDRVSVEGLALHLGVTKGSFYWHFPDRAALISSALDMWEQQATVDVIDELNTIVDPAARLRALFLTSFGDVALGPVDAALAARVDDPTVGPVVRRVTARRIEFLEATYRRLGFTSAQAASRARITYCTYVGHFQVRRSLPDDPVLTEPSTTYLRHLHQVLVTK